MQAGAQERIAPYFSNESNHACAATMAVGCVKDSNLRRIKINTEVYEKAIYFKVSASCVPRTIDRWRSCDVMVRTIEALNLGIVLTNAYFRQEVAITVVHGLLASEPK